MAERIVRANGVDLCVDAIGDPADPAVLLIGGAAAPMDWWEDDFCLRLARAGRHVVRYDHRDTGRSVTYPVGAPRYTKPDLAADAVGVLDALGLRAAHVVGMSMGGALAQRVAVEHPDRVRSLVLMSTSPGAPGTPGLPAMSEELFAAGPPDWSDPVERIVAGERRFSAARYFDEERVRALAERAVRRSADAVAGMVNHWLIDEGEPVRARLGEIAVPVLVVHGTVDPLLPFGHGEALAREIPGAELLVLEGVGHQMPPRELWGTVIPALLRHTA